jgi:hypothetical protein
MTTMLELTPGCNLPDYCDAPHHEELRYVIEIGL